MKKIFPVFACLFSVLFMFASCSVDSADSGNGAKSSDSETKTDKDTTQQATYTITFELNGGIWTTDYIPPSSYTVDDVLVLPDAGNLTKTGYGFTGWHEKSDLSDDSIIQIAKGTTGNKKYYASWETGMANYTVRHYKQNISKTGYDESVSDKQILTGRINALTSASAISYEGFTAQEFSQVVIKEDGTSEICICYGRNTYTVSFDTDGGSSIFAKKITYGESVTEPTNPERAGYVFAGWYLDSNLTITYDFACTVSSDITLYAKWEYGDTTYTVRHFKQNISKSGYEEAFSDKQVLIGKTNDLTSASSISYEGFTAESFSQSEIKADGTSEVCIYYSRNSYTVTFETNGGSIIPDKTVIYGESVDEPIAPTKAGYVFKGWYLDTDFFAMPIFGYTIDINTTLYAKWDAVEYSIEFELNGGNWESDYNVKSDFTVEDSVVLPDAGKLTKTGYGFTGWHEKSDLSDTAILQIQNGTVGNKKYYASWTAGMVNYTVRHFKQNISKNGYDEVTEDAQVLTGETGSRTSVVALSYEGFTAESFSQIEIKADGTSEVKIYYNRNSYTVTFDTNGGSDIPDKTITYGEKLNEPTAPSKAGYLFKGWYTHIDFSSLYTFGNIIDDNITLYAKWENTAGISVIISPNSTITMSKSETADTITLTATSGHSSYSWKIDDTVATNFSGANVSENTLTINKSELVAGYRYQINLYAPKNGIPYSAQITVKKGE